MAPRARSLESSAAFLEPSSDLPSRPFRPTDGAQVAGFGFWIAIGTATMTSIAFGVAIATPPLSGALCEGHCFEYPYLEIGSRFPRDYYWMFPAIAATLLYLALTVALHARVVSSKRHITRLGLAISTMASLTLITNYFVQLAVIQPSLVAGEADGVSLLTQYNQHGIFIALEELGFVLMSFSFLCMVPSLSTSTRLERAIRVIFNGGFALTMLALGWMLIHYGHARGYFFEIAAISINWLVLIATSSMLAVVFRRDLTFARRQLALPRSPIATLAQDGHGNLLR